MYTPTTKPNHIRAIPFYEGKLIVTQIKVGDHFINVYCHRSDDKLFNEGSYIKIMKDLVGDVTLPLTGKHTLPATAEGLQRAITVLGTIESTGSVEGG